MPSSPPPPRDVRSPVSRGHVVVVDDQEAIREFLDELLTRHGYHVTAVGSGEDALAACRRNPPQVLLTDLAMTPMTGRELIDRVREHSPSTVAVVLTGFGSIESAVELMRRGVFDVVTKPCRTEEITATVDKALQHHDALQANEDLRERLRVQDKLAMIGRLAAGVAHELNNPLDAALRCVRLTRDRVDDNEAHEYLDLAEMGMQRMADIVQSLLTFSRNAAVEQAPQPLGSLIREAVAAVTLALADDAPEVEVGIGAGLEGAPVPRGLHQVLTNLLRNASDAAGPTATIQARAARHEGEVVIEIEDDGPGIPADIRGRVFEPFFTTKDPGKGTGLGLPLSARLVEKFGGAIHVECPPDGGTIVRVTLPMPRVAVAMAEGA